MNARRTVDNITFVFFKNISCISGQTGKFAKNIISQAEYRTAEARLGVQEEHKSHEFNAFLLYRNIDPNRMNQKNNINIFLSE